jgi:hypothetical protein
LEATRNQGRTLASAIHHKSSNLLSLAQKIEIGVPTATNISAELVKIEQEIQAGGIDARILREFRDSVDYVRKTAWAVQEWQERELQKHDPHTLLPLITSERIRRGTQLSKAITTDLERHEVTRETAGMNEFFQAIEGLYSRVAVLFREP